MVEVKTEEATSTVHIESEMHDAYLDYAMSVIVARALPDARDGMKPVHRRILYAMHEMGMRAGAEFKKSARIVGEVLGKYHPHGDGAVYDTMVRLAQDFSMRNPLLEGQGNFGSIDGDGPAAMRYTEVRMAAIGEGMMADITRDTVAFADNFDGTLKEPLVLPSKIPNLLVNGASGIAVGMSTSIPPHNLGEICDALQFLLSQWERLGEIRHQELMEFIQGPDFPTGGILLRHPDGANAENGDSLSAAYESGRGKITLRARLHVETMGRGRNGIIITQLPYQVNKASLVERIASLARNGRLEGLADLRDESDRQGLRLVLELQRNVEPQTLLPQLYRDTPLQYTYSIILLALVDGEPKLISLKQALRIFLEHRLVVLRRRSLFEKRKAEERVAVLFGLLLALSHLDEVVKVIRRSRNSQTARRNLRNALRYPVKSKRNDDVTYRKISDQQARAILEMPLGRLVSLERRKLQAEHKELKQRIRELDALLQNDALQRAAISQELAEVQEQFNDPRRTKLLDRTQDSEQDTGGDLPQICWVTQSYSGKLGCIEGDAPPPPNTRNRDSMRLLQRVDTTQPIFAFTASGLCAEINAHDLPKVSMAHQGKTPAYVSPLAQGEEIIALLGFLPEETADDFIFLATERGLVKRIALRQLPKGRHNTFRVFKLQQGDRLVSAIRHDEGDEIVMISAAGRMICFAANQVRAVSTLSTSGMRGMRVSADVDRVVALQSVPPESEAWLWFITAEGLAGRKELAKFSRRKRGAGGVLVMKLPPGSQGLRAAALGELRSQLLTISSQGRGRKVRLGKVPHLRLSSKLGGEAVNLRYGESVIAVLPLPSSGY